MKNKREVKYTKWVDSYNDHYKIALNNFKMGLKAVPNDEIIKLINEVYASALKTLRLYLANNGLFKQTNLDVIKESFYIDFIEDGEEWIEIFEQLEISNDAPIDSNFIDKCTTTFDRLNEKFIGVLENDS